MKLPRRTFVKYLGEGVLVLGILKLTFLSSPDTSKHVLRPPGAASEDSFNMLCIRCDICRQVCPTHTIVLTGFENGIVAINTPKIDPLKGPCEFYRGRCEEGMQCGQHCPTGALQSVNKNSVKLGTAILIPEYCLAYQGKECVVCDEMCPIPEAITVTDDLKPVFHGNQCIGCGECVYACPALPKALILQPNGNAPANGKGSTQ